MRLILIFLTFLTMMASCHKKDNETPLRYFEVGMRINLQPDEWRDSAFVVATRDPRVLEQVELELAKPVEERKKLVVGDLLPGSGGYNKNGSLTFSWHMNENKWELGDMTIEIVDGRPYSDVELHLDYWLNQVKAFGSWASYIKKEIPKP